MMLDLRNSCDRQHVSKALNVGRCRSRVCMSGSGGTSGPVNILVFPYIELVVDMRTFYGYQVYDGHTILTEY